MATCNPTDLVADAKCFECLSKQQLQAVIAQLLCNINFSGAGGGQAQTPWQQNINANNFDLLDASSNTILDTSARVFYDSDGNTKISLGTTDAVLQIPNDINTDPIRMTGGDGGEFFVCSGTVEFDGFDINHFADRYVTLRGFSGNRQSIDGNNFFLIPITQAGKSAVVGATSIAVVFATAMPDANYSVALTGSAALVSPFISAISSTGFTVTLTAFTGTMYWTVTQHSQ